MKRVWTRLSVRWRALRSSGRLRNCLVFLLFVAIAAVFWFVLALNDNVQRNLTVRLNIAGVPDSVKFITDPPSTIHVSVRDRGSALMRAGVFRTPVMTVQYRDYLHGSSFVMTHTDIVAALKATFSSSASILSTSVDSLRLAVATGRGRRVPVQCSVDATPAAGSIIYGSPSATPTGVIAYGPKSVLDTLTRVYTARVVRRDLQEPANLTVSLRPVAGVRLEPSEVKVHIPVEPLVSKTYRVSVTPTNVPEGVELLLFPSVVPVDVFVPMSCFSTDHTPVEAWVDYNDVALPTDKVPVRIRVVSQDAFRATEEIDSVEYAVVR